MLFIRTKTQDGIFTFSAQTYNDADTIFDTLTPTRNDTFIYCGESADEKSGKVLRRVNRNNKPTRLYRYLGQRRYDDTHWEEYGTKEWCEQRAKETNDKRDGWWSISATVIKVAGDLWKVYYTEPYTD